MRTLAKMLPKVTKSLTLYREICDKGIIKWALFLTS